MISYRYIRSIYDYYKNKYSPQIIKHDNFVSVIQVCTVIFNLYVYKYLYKCRDPLILGGPNAFKFNVKTKTSCLVLVRGECLIYC